MSEILEAADSTRPLAGTSDAQRQREELILLRDHLEQLLRPLFHAMPREDVESLLAGCGNPELIHFGRDAVAASVVTAMLQEPARWARAREGIRRGCQRGHARSAEPSAQREAAGLTEQLLDRLDFGLVAYQRKRSELNAALQETRAGRSQSRPDDVVLTRGRPVLPDARRETR